jgi:type I restriction enzyme S subunit
MAETLFRQWFVERCPEPVEGEEKEEWEIKKLGAIAEIQNGFAFSSKDYVEYADTHLEVFKMGHIQKGGGLRTDPKRDYVPRSERLKRWILNKGDIVMAMTDMKDNVVILGVPAMIDKDDNYVLNQRVARIYLKDKSNLISNYLLFIQLKDVDFIQELQSKANSGVQVNLSTESIKDSDIIIPPLAIQKEKSPIIDDLYTKVELNQTQIRTLTALRDTLLPKLMSGEVRVEE